MKDKDSKKYNYEKLIKSIILIIVLYVIFLIAFNNVDNINVSFINISIYFMNWVGVFILYYAFISWRKKTNTKFSPYIILFLFLFLFNYGQCFMWAIGIHTSSEIGMNSNVGILYPDIILKTQILTCISMVFFHMGAMNCYRFKKNIKNANSEENSAAAFKLIGWSIALLSIPTTLYKSWQAFKFSQSYGYTALYYGDTAQGGIFSYLSFLFFPSLICLLLGYKFSKKSLVFVNLIFGLYMIINVMSGDRGNWIYKLLILMWCNIIANESSIKKLRKKIVIYVIFFIICIPIVTTIVTFREVGLQSLINTDISMLFNKLIDPYIKPIFEMGKSMRVLGILLRDNLHNSWAYGSTYIPAILGMTLPRFKVFFGYPDLYLENWFSQEYLGLKNYGEGFTMIGEAYLNFGELLTPFVLLVIGFLLGTLLYYNRDYSKSNNKNLTQIFVIATSCSTFAGYARGSLTYFARMWFWGTVTIYILVNLLVKVASRKCNFNEEKQ